MRNRWNEKFAARIPIDSLAMRVATSRLLGQDADLVLHGGGNTSVKLKQKTIFGEQDVLYVKGSGWDLATIEPQGFAPLKLRELLMLLRQERLSDGDMVKYQRMLLLDPFAPNPSIEALLHALVPFKFVDHTHADAILTLTNTPRGEKWVREVFGKNMLIIRYVKPGFALAKEVFRRTRGMDWAQCDGIVLMNHGIFTFDDSARASYSKMIDLVTKAERFLKKKGASARAGAAPGNVPLVELARARKHVSKYLGQAAVAIANASAPHKAFSDLPGVASLAARGPITPDHVIRTKVDAAVFGPNPVNDVDAYASAYIAYFKKHASGSLTRLDPAPRWAVWRGVGTVAFAGTRAEAAVVSDIVDHTVKTIQRAAALGGWRPLSKKDLFDIEYWELEQAKLKKGGAKPPFQGKIAFVTGAASGIGKACVESLVNKGAVVGALDVNPAVKKLGGDNVLPLVCDVTDKAAVVKSVEKIVERFGGLDFFVSNAGIFPPSKTLPDIDESLWQRSVDINLTSHRAAMQACLPYLEHGVDPAIVIVGSKNVPAPGPGAAAYSVAKAGLTQLARVAALELGRKKIRVNVIHPNAVYDTGIWSDDILKTRAKHYGLSVAKYKTNNVLGVAITSADVAEMVSGMLGPLFLKTTGAQIPIDGGVERII